ncbi:hypothetical protein BD779DRAFT_1669495 [Infundibulicybe gibba]|nr:hypothetical protein BD779DRAFT_1669495 [Infundibulicybe gibba]
MNPSYLTRVVKVEDISGEPHNIRRIFSSCGEIHALYPYTSGNTNHAHFFIEFADPESSSRALTLKHGVLGLHAYEVATDSRLAYQYSSVNPHTRRNSTPGSNTISSATLENDVTQGQIISPPAPALAPSLAPYLSFSFEHRIQLSVGGQILTFDLDTLDRDPSVIISLLKTAASERATWMIVAAHYRRRGYPHPAIRVVDAMMLELTRRGVSPDEQKPAYILLAGCESDLAKAGKLENAHPSEVASHYSKAQMWLQKVYGADNTPRHLQPEPRLASNPLSHNSVASSMTQERRSVRESRSSPLPRPPSDISRNKWLRTGSDHQKILEREIECLRDRQRNHLADLSQTRTAKRKLECSLAQERQVRRRLEHQVDLLSRTRDSTHKAKRMRMMDQPRRRLGEKTNRGGEREMRKYDDNYGDHAHGPPFNNLKNKGA